MATQSKSDSEKYKKPNNEGYIVASGHTDSLLYVHNGVMTALNSLWLIYLFMRE